MRAIFILNFILLFNLSLNAQDIYNKFDQKGNKEGLWKGFFSDTKNLKYEGTFESGKEVGLFTFYENSKSKRLVATREFNPTDNSAYTIIYDPFKNIVSEGKVINKLSEGTWKYFHKGSKNIMTLENYSKGKLEGLRSVFYPSGKIAEEVFYRNNLKNGQYKKYTEAGIVLEESHYKNNEFEGIAIFRDADSGLIVSTGKFVNGKKVGVWQFFKDGKLLNEQNMSFLKRIDKSPK